MFCFDQGHKQRTLLYPAYKGNRSQMLPEEERALSSFKKQIRMLRSVYLKDSGFKNVHTQPGYEADDLIASVCHNLPGRDEAIIIASDEDFYQLLSKRVLMWNPTTREPMTYRLFKQRYGIEPNQWPTVLAMAGGHDNIKGIAGIGPVTACKYLRGELPHSCQAYAKILEGQKITRENLKLVTLPIAGTKRIVPKLDMEPGLWNKVIARLEMKSLAE